MNLLRKLFDRTDGGSLSGRDAINEGDLFYSVSGNLFYVHKLIRVRKETWHVLTYKPITSKPTVDMIPFLEVAIYHAPVHRNGFESPEYLSSPGITDSELHGYHTYLRIADDFEELAVIANDYFAKASAATDNGDHEAAIANYTLCIGVAPVYWEAIDNRAFSKMDLGRWSDAIEDFNLSLAINPGNNLAIFSIGECYLRLKKTDKAKKQFELVLQTDPAHELALSFLKKTNAA
ncbi:MAG: tetratricopeptide repeat protein [Flavitalea sp.]